MDITQLQKSNNKFMRTVDFQSDSIVAGFITEFAVDTMKSYNKEEQGFLKGPRSRDIRLLYTSINILFYDNDVYVEIIKAKFCNSL